MLSLRPAVRAGWLLALAVCAALAGSSPAMAAVRGLSGPPYPNAQWAAWGLKVSFESGAPQIRFAAYVGVEDGDPLAPGNQPQVLGKLVEDISTQCITRSTTGAPNPALTVDRAGYASFDGTLYLECRTPDWSAMVRELAPHLKPAFLGACECSPRRSPLWASADVIINPVAAGSSRQNPLLDARSLGFTFSLPTSGGAAQTRLGRSNGNADSPSWVYDSSAGNRLLAGVNGLLAVRIIDFFGGIPYLTNNGWRPFLERQVFDDRVGQWLEPANSGATRRAPVAQFSVTTGPGTIQIGRDSATGETFSGKLRSLHGDPGCFAD